MNKEFLVGLVVVLVVIGGPIVWVGHWIYKEAFVPDYELFAWNSCKNASEQATGGGIREGIKFAYAGSKKDDNLAPEGSGRFHYIWRKEHAVLKNGKQVRVVCRGTLQPLWITYLSIDGIRIEYED